MDYPKFQISKGSDAQFYFHLYAANAKNILDSEAYTEKSACENGIDAVKNNAENDAHYQRKTSSNGEFYFVLVAGNGEVIGKSEMYTTEQARESGIESVKRNAPMAGIEEIG